MINNSHKFSLPIHNPFYKLNEKQKKLIWEGNEYFKGLNFFFKKIESKTYKIQNRVLLSRYRGKTKCNECNGSRLRKETENVKVNNKSVPQLLKLSINELAKFFNEFIISSVLCTCLGIMKVTKFLIFLFNFKCVFAHIISSL